MKNSNALAKLKLHIKPGGLTPNPLLTRRQKSGEGEVCKIQNSLRKNEINMTERKPVHEVNENINLFQQGLLLEIINGGKITHKHRYDSILRVDIKMPYMVEQSTIDKFINLTIGGDDNDNLTVKHQSGLRSFLLDALTLTKVVAENKHLTLFFNRDSASYINNFSEELTLENLKLYLTNAFNTRKQELHQPNKKIGLKQGKRSRRKNGNY